MYESVLVALCRPGFERECLAELTEQAAWAGSYGWAEPEAGSGFLRFRTPDALSLYQSLPPLVFARECWPLVAELDNLPSADRAEPIAQALVGNEPAGQLFCDTTEGDRYRATARFAGKFVHPLRQTLRAEGLLTPVDEPERPALHALFLHSGHVLLGYDRAGRRPQWPMGIARLRSPPSAPSRSTLKLEEAFHRFLGPAWRQTLNASHTAVDLGAAPGGWTWQLVQQGLMVQAVDNGPMDEGLMASGQVEHLREDGFTWVPDYPVDWLVCDMVDSPYRVADRMQHWILNGWARNAIFNLKLPMKKRWQTWKDIHNQLSGALADVTPPAQLQAAQLYFDREEVTVCLSQAGSDRIRA